MNKPDVSKWVAGGVNAFSLIVVLLATSILSPTFTMSFYEYEFGKNDTYNVVRMEKEDLLAVTEHMLDYMKGKEPELNIMTKINGQERLFFSEREIFHMRDVKGLLMLCYTVRNAAAILFVLSLGFLIFSKSEWKKYIFKSWRNVSAGVFISFAALTGLICLDFDNAFTIFHKMFFRNDLWLLDPNVDLLINIVPTPFFIDIAIFVIALFVFFLSGMFLSGYFLNKKYENL